MIRIQSVLAMSLLLVSSSLAQQSQFQKEVTERAGEVQNADGSPVKLSEASWVDVSLDESTTAGRRRSVKVQNVSGRAIRRVNTVFWFRFTECGWAASSHAVDSLGPYETREILNRGSLFFRRPDKAELLIVLQGVQFDDGEVWVPDRRQTGPLIFCVLGHYRTRQLLIMQNCTIDADSYSVLLEVADPKVASYRLGIVRDTADSFEVNIGKQITLEDSGVAVIGIRTSGRAVSEASGGGGHLHCGAHVHGRSALGPGYEPRRTVLGELNSSAEVCAQVSM
jgi:hypothetical protein